MKKKAYISPETEVVAIKIEQLMGFTISGENLHSDPDPDESEDDNRSRRHRNVWDDNEEEEEW
jgi:hypothetical protein